MGGEGEAQSAPSATSRSSETFEHTAGDDLGEVLERYARPDRRVLDRRVQAPDPDAIVDERRRGERRAPIADPQVENSSEPT